MSLRTRLSGPLIATLFLGAAPAYAQDGASTVTLDEARALALENSWDRISVENSIAQAELLLDSARALLRPSIDASGSYTYNGVVSEFAFPNVYEPLVPYLAEVQGQLNPSLPDPAIFGEASGSSSEINPRHDVRGSLIVSQTLFNPRAFPLRRQALATIDLVEHGREQVARGIDQAVIGAYFGACAAQRYIAIAERNVELATLNADRAQVSFDEGIGNRFEANRARVDLAAAQRDLENARTVYQQSIEALATLMLRDADFDVVDPGPAALPSDIDGAALAALSTRADVTVWDYQAELQEQRVNEARLQWLPAVYGSLAGNLQRKSAFSNDIFTWTLGVSATWNLYDGGLRRAERQRREFDLAEAEIRRDQAESQVASEVDQLVLAIELQERNIALATQQADLAHSNVDVTQYALEQGAATALEVQYAQQQAFLSDIALADAEVTLQQRRWELALALDLL